ncbi:MAG: hypothetical protein JNL08_01555 [Planctomycetes bacterium]|nr:hypothetical protein [Planctomycetota bacterium]
MHAIDADGANRLVATVVVPDRRDRVDPSLGGDPHAVRSAALDLRHGEQRLHVVDDRGRSTTVALAAPAHGWAIVFVGADRLEALADSGPRGLD